MKTLHSVALFLGLALWVTIGSRESQDMRFTQAAHADKASTNEGAIFLYSNGANLGRLHWT